MKRRDLGVRTKGTYVEQGRSYKLDAIDPALWRAFRQRAQQERRSVRGLLLGWIRNWTAGRRPDEGPGGDPQHGDA